MKAIFGREFEPPDESSLADGAHAAGKALAGVVGAAEVFELFVASPYRRRLQSWMEDVAQGLRDLDARGVDVSKLAQDPEFVDVVISATQVAQRTSQELKRQALRNVIVNAALPTAPDADRRQMFIGLVDRLTPSHIRLLGLFRDPRAWPASRPLKTASSAYHVAMEAFPELRGNEEFVDLLWEDLKGAAVHRSGSLRTMVSDPLTPRISDLGRQFLAFIEEPPA